MQNDVNNETEAATTGEASVGETNQQERPAEAQAPVVAPAATPAAAEETGTETPSAEMPTQDEAASTTSAETPAADETPSTPPAAQPERIEPRRVPKPAALPEVVEEKSGEIDFAAILERFESEQTVYHAGDLVEGKVVGVSERGALVDFGYKSEGIIPAEEIGEGGEPLNVGDTVEVVIKSIHSGDAPPQLSRTDAKSRKVWNDLDEAYKNDQPVTGRIVDKTKGGLTVDLNGIEAFLPGSQIDSRPIRGLDTYIGQEIEAKIIKFSRRRNNIVLSRKVITDVAINEQKNETFSKIDAGYVVEGTIKNLTEYGAFVDIGGIDGLLHVTDMSWGRLQNPGDNFKVGEQLQVKVLKLDRERDKVSLGYKQLLPDPWSTVVEVYPVDSRVTGKISSVTEYGIFVELEPGVEGLVHVSEISWSKRGANPKRQYRKGDEVEVQVLGVDAHEKRISLGMKQLQDNPWDTVALRYPVGSRITGRVRNITEFGAFIEVEDGIDGLVHISDLSWGKKIKHPKDILKKDQEVEAIVTNIDPRGQRLSLSMKDLTPSAWAGFVATHRPGDTVRGKVSRFTSFGAFVELGEGLEGLCHISELSDERVEKPDDVVQLGQEMDFKILRIENEDQKIGLSARAVGRSDEPSADGRQFSTEAKGGMASLGELANLVKGGAEEEAKAEPTKEEKEAAKREKKEKARREYEETAAREAAAEAEPASDSAEAPAESSSTDEAASEAEPASESAETPAESSSPDEPASEAEPASESAETPVESSSPDEPASEAEPASESAEAAAETAADAPEVASEATSEAEANDREAAAAEVQSEAEGEAQPTPTQEGDEPPTNLTEEVKEESEQQSA